MKKYALILGLALATLSGSPGAVEPAKVQVDAQASCPGEGLATELDRRRSGYAFVIEPAAPLYRYASVRAPRIERTLKPLTRVECYAGVGLEDRYRVLISTEVEDPDTGGSRTLCGWIDSDVLLQQAGMSADHPCPEVEERKIRDYHAEGPKKDSPLNLKLLISNFNLDTETLSAATENRRPRVPAFAYPGGPKAADVSIYTVFPVFDFTEHAGEDHFLIGAGTERLLGWVRRQDAAIWDNRLTLFFKEGAANANIYYLRTHLQAARRGEEDRPLATPPSNLSEALNKSRNTFAKFPVLEGQTGDDFNPKGYRIAFIGNWCNQGEDCRRLDPGSANRRMALGDRLRELERADILFVIDATESMAPYFGAVATAVKGATVARYSEDTRIRLGVSLYGDYLGEATGPGSRMQYKTPIPLTQIFDGDEFDGLPAEGTFSDPRADKPEAVYGALLKATTETDWRESGRHLIVHIGDHGPRSAKPPPALLGALREKAILYIPIAVTSRYSAAHNRAFVTATQAILDNHKTPKGNPLGPPSVLWAYGPDRTNSLGIDETRRKLRRVLDGGLDQAEQIKGQVLDELYAIAGEETAPEPAIQSGDMDEIAAGFAHITPALREIFDLEPEKIELIKRQRQLVAPGYVAKFDPRTGQDQWDYSVAVDPETMPPLEATIGSLCLAATRSSAKHKLTASIRTLTQSMSGDEIKNTESLYDYLEKVLRIPLAEDTILRKPIGELQRNLVNADPEELRAFKQEVCRSALLLKLVRSSQRLATMDAMRWDEEREEWRYDEALYFRWNYAPESGGEFIYIPLEFFPKPKGSG